MNASDFANLRLPNSLSTISIPLVQGVFDEPRIPRGRGVIPDSSYESPSTFNKLKSSVQKIIGERKVVTYNFQKEERKKTDLQRRRAMIGMFGFQGKTQSAIFLISNFYYENNC